MTCELMAEKLRLPATRKITSHGLEAAVAAGFALGGLEQAVDGFEEAVGLSGLSPGDDTVEMIEDHLGDLLHRLDLGAHHVGAPALEHGGHDVDLLAIEDLAQLLAVEPGARGALGGDLGDEGVEIGPLAFGQALAVLEQRPAQALEAGIGFLLDAAGLIDGGWKHER